MTDQLTRGQMRKILLKHRGELARIALETQVSPTAVTLVLAGKSKSGRIMDACRKRVAEIQEAEARAEQEPQAVCA
jgi:hypothetical protein